MAPPFVTMVKPPRYAKLEPRNAGTLPLHRKWNSSVPRPAQSSVVLTLRPVSRGTSTVAPNIANMCCAPRINSLGVPSCLAS